MGQRNLTREESSGEVLDGTGSVLVTITATSVSFGSARTLSSPVAESALATVTVAARIPATTIAQAQTAVVAFAPYAGTISAISLIPDATHTGAATNFASIAFTNQTATLTPVAAVDYDSGTDLTGVADNAQTIVTAGGADVVAAGDVITATFTKTASGQTTVAMLAVVTFTKA